MNELPLETVHSDLVPILNHALQIPAIPHTPPLCTDISIAILHHLPLESFAAAVTPMYTGAIESAQRRSTNSRQRQHIVSSLLDACTTSMSSAGTKRTSLEALEERTTSGLSCHCRRDQANIQKTGILPNANNKLVSRNTQRTSENDKVPGQLSASSCRHVKLRTHGGIHLCSSFEFFASVSRLPLLRRSEIQSQRTESMLLSPRRL
ncbi:hypothetical protein FB45DRAFT_1002711 [Roridomyces roridus]|uniref:Uncharacterized protein n=1 Tax=Roridomyces roridus TaxID=1738132 RepID=A0AAD7C0J8_9AGAR|nr:hypothetical protein FB45DRAFT_1002711 [Roridomyces roridus]